MLYGDNNNSTVRIRMLYRAEIVEELIPEINSYKKQNQLRDRLTALDQLLDRGVTYWNSNSIKHLDLIRNYYKLFFNGKLKNMNYPNNRLTKLIETKIDPTIVLKKNDETREILNQLPTIDRLFFFVYCGLQSWDEEISKNPNSTCDKMLEYRGFKFNISNKKYDCIQDIKRALDCMGDEHEKNNNFKEEILEKAEIQSRNKKEAIIQGFREMGIRYIYKYRTVNDFLDQIISKNELWFSDADSLNDACELRPLYKKDVPYKINLKKFHRSVKVSCFSACNDEDLLWSHYADAHKGVCIEFDLYKDTDFFYSIMPVRYIENITPIEPTDLDIKTSELALKMMYTKKHQWAYERELRLIRINNLPPEQCNISDSTHIVSENYKEPNYNQFKKEALSKIIFGCRMSYKDKRHLRSILKKYGYNHISFAECVILPENLKLVIKEIE